ncbi:DNA damage-inducible protein 1 [Beauveria bassiana]|nr:DNA damage-inducible protein 1 [Beauveria bassiana]
MLSWTLEKQSAVLRSESAEISLSPPMRHIFSIAVQASDTPRHRWNFTSLRPFNLPAHPNTANDPLPRQLLRLPPCELDHFDPDTAFSFVRLTSLFSTRRVTLNIFDRKAARDTLLTLEIFPDMTLSTLRESIQAEAKVLPDTQHIYHNGKALTEDTKTMEQMQINDGDLLAVHVREKRPNPNPQAQAARPAPPQPQPQPSAGTNDPEMIRLQVLGDPNLRQQLQRQHSELADAVDDPARFAGILRESQDRERRERLERQRQIEQLNDDPFNVENQRKIEEMIRQERVMENLQNAMEHNPEVFGRVHMLYVNVEVNGHKVKAFVDSGAQATIMSPSCAEACGIMRLVDTRFAGVARGVGTANIIGRVHSAQIKIGAMHLPCSFTVMEGKGMDLLLGLDMLKRYQATIDLAKDKLVIQGEEIPFLGEAEIPKEEDGNQNEPTIPGPAGTTIGQRSGAIEPPSEASAPAPQSAAGASSIPATTAAALGSAPAPATAAATAQPAAAGPAIQPQHIETLMGMGATREQAVQALQAAEGNVDVAAGIIFF